MIRGTQFGKTDPLKQPQFKPTKLELPQNKYEYKPYKPSHVGMYGEKETQPRKTQKPSPKKQIPKPVPETKQTFRTQRKLKTFKSYELDSGPDIKIKNTGPDYRVKEYKYTDPDLLKTHRIKTPPPEPYKAPFKYEKGKEWSNKGHEDYKLTEQNNLGMRHFHYGFVDDTIMSKQTSEKHRLVMVPKTPEQKPVAAIKPIPKKPKSPVEARKVAQVAAVTQPPPKKKFVNSSTQHVAPGNKTSQTQTQKASVKNTTIQTDTPQSLPQVAGVGAVMASPLHKPSKSKSVQATEPQKKVAVAGTQYTGPSTKQATIQTSPVMFATQTPRRIHSPELARAVPVEASRRSPETMFYQRSLSPQMAPRMDTPGNQVHTKHKTS